MIFKKITSNRDLGDTVYSEIKKEFRPYFTTAGQSVKRTANKYPKFLFAMMVINIVLSIILCLPLYRAKKETEKAPKLTIAAPVSTGFDRIMLAGAALQQTIRLKKQVDSLMQKSSLTKADSATLWSDLGQLQQINQIKPLKK